VSDCDSYWSETCSQYWMKEYHYIVILLLI
jgi:hypothetical protein